MTLPAPALTAAQRRFVDSLPVARLATADRHGAPHVLPVCFVIDDDSLYVTVDEKPKDLRRELKRLRNVAENPQAAVVVDRYDADWSRLGWVMLRGRAEILREGAEHDRAQALLRARYPRYAEMALAPLPVIAMRIARVTSWGAVDAL